METTREGPFVFKHFKNKDWCIAVSPDNKIQLQAVSNEPQQRWFAHKSAEYFKLEHEASGLFL